MRTGIHTGPVTAAVSGKRKVSYDIKGDTVNTASRIEAVSDFGSILISVMTYELVKEFFDCEYFGKLPVKYKGDLQMYRVKGLKPEFSAQWGGHCSQTMPSGLNSDLFSLLTSRKFILDKLERELPEYFIIIM